MLPRDWKVLKKFPDHPNAEPAFYSAGEYWKKVAIGEVGIYTRYLRRYRGVSPDNTMAAHYRRIDIV